MADRPKLGDISNISYIPNREIIDPEEHSILPKSTSFNKLDQIKYSKNNKSKLGPKAGAADSQADQQEARPVAGLDSLATRLRAIDRRFGLGALPGPFTAPPSKLDSLADLSPAGPRNIDWKLAPQPELGIGSIAGRPLEGKYNVLLDLLEAESQRRADILGWPDLTPLGFRPGFGVTPLPGSTDDFEARRWELRRRLSAEAEARANAKIQEPKIIELSFKIEENTKNIIFKKDHYNKEDTNRGFPPK